MIIAFVAENMYSFHAVIIWRAGQTNRNDREEARGGEVSACTEFRQHVVVFCCSSMRAA